MAWFRAQPECPIDPQSREWIERRWTWLTEEFGLERLESTEVVLPTPEFFPDAYAGTVDDVRTILDRVCDYMAIAPATVELSIYEDRNPVFDEQGRQGTAGLYEEENGKARIWIEVGNLDNPLALVAVMAHELGHVYLLGQRRVSRQDDDHEPLTDLLTVFFGLGVFTANAVIWEQSWRVGTASSWSMGRQGYLTMPMYGYALALFAHARDEEDPPWAKSLRGDVHSAFIMAYRFLAAVDRVDASPMAVTPAAAEDMSDDNDDPGLEEADPEGPSLTAEELLGRYARGERDFRKARLQGVRLCGADLRGSDFTDADLSRADLTDVVLSESELRDADLQDAILRRATLRRASLCEADLGGADLSEADLTGADLRGASFNRSLLRGTILVRLLSDSSTDFSDADLCGAICDANLQSQGAYQGPVIDRLAVAFGRISQRIFNIAFFGLGMLICAGICGGLVGHPLATEIGIQGFAEFCAVVGAISFVVVFVWSTRRFRS